MGGGPSLAPDAKHLKTVKQKYQPQEEALRGSSQWPLSVSVTQKKLPQFFLTCQPLAGGFHRVADVFVATVFPRGCEKQ